MPSIFFKCMMKKTITPVISVILLIMLTIAVSATAWYWVNNLQGSLESGAGEGVESATQMVQYSMVGLTCYSATNTTVINLRNNGNTNISSAELILVKIFDNAGNELSLNSTTIRGTAAGDIGTSGTSSIKTINATFYGYNLQSATRYRVVTDIKGVITSSYCTAI